MIKSIKRFLFLIDVTKKVIANIVSRFRIQKWTKCQVVHYANGYKSRCAKMHLYQFPSQAANKTLNASNAIPSDGTMDLPVAEPVSATNSFQVIHVFKMCPYFCHKYYSYHRNYATFSD